MGLKRTKLQAVNSVTGITTVGIFTVGVTNTGGPVGVASTTYVRGVIMHNTGLATATSSLYIYPGGTARPEATGYGVCLLYTSPSPRDLSTSRMPSSA